MDSQTWYADLAKPSWAPPAWAFGPVWTVLYAVIAVTFFYAAFLVFKGKAPWIVFLPFALNLIANGAFTPLQFGLRSNVLAALDISLVLGTLIWLLFAIWPYAAWVALANIPYLIWVSFATFLQITITLKNL